MMRWKTICSASSIEELQKLINSYYSSMDYVIGGDESNKDWPVIDTKTYRKMRQRVRYHRKKWKFGYYT